MIRFAITDVPIDEAAEGASLADPRAGALATFSGWVRNHNAGQQVASLEYEAYEALALSEGKRILEQAADKFGLHGATCVHRTGKLAIGDMAVWVGATASHRDEAFRAARFIIDEIKARLPIWKREVYEDGTVEWVNCQRCADHVHHCHDAEASYYARQVRSPDVGKAGQEMLKAARVLLIGAGGLGSPALQALAGAGVGHIGICDFDVLETSNLHRQYLYAHADVGGDKTELARERLIRANPHIAITAHGEKFSNSNAERLVGQYDIVLCCADNLAAKFLANQTCVSLGRSLVLASVYRFDGELLTVTPGSDAGCFACLWPGAPEEPASCAEAGIIGAVPALLGTMQALETIKLILGLDTPSCNSLVLVDGMSLRTTHISRRRNSSCPVCAVGDAALQSAMACEAV